MKFYKLEINPGEEVMETLEKKFNELKINGNGSMTLIGATDECAIHTMLQKDPRQNTLQTIKHPAELHGTGEIREGKPHIHCTLGVKDGKSITGHLHWAKVKTWFVHVYLITE